MQFELEKAIPVLERTPLVIESLLYGLDDEWVHSNEGGDSWTPFEIVAHLVHGEKTDWIPRTQVILGEGSKEFNAATPDAPTVKYFSYSAAATFPIYSPFYVSYKYIKAIEGDKPLALAGWEDKLGWGVRRFGPLKLQEAMARRGLA